jgi:hypothetical protein
MTIGIALVTLIYNALDDLRGDFPQMLEEEVVPIGEWEEIAQEPSKHDTDDTTNKR